MPFQDLRKGVWLVACPRQDPCVPGCGEQSTDIQLGWPSRCVHFADGKTNLVVVSSALRSQCTPPSPTPLPRGRISAPAMLVKLCGPRALYFTSLRFRFPLLLKQNHIPDLTGFV